MISTKNKCFLSDSLFFGKKRVPTGGADVDKRLGPMFIRAWANLIDMTN